MDQRSYRERCSLNIRLLREMSSLADRFARASEVTRVNALKEYVEGLHRFTDRVLRELEAEYYALAEVAKLSKPSSDRPAAENGPADTEDGESLRQIGGIFHCLSDSALVGVASGDRDTVLTANDGFLQMVGYSRADLEAGRLRWPEMTPPEYQHLDAAGLAALAATGKCQPFRKEYWRKDGTRVPIMIGAAALTRNPCSKWACFILDLSHASSGLRDMPGADGVVR